MKPIPLGRPAIGSEEISNVTQVLKSGWLTHGDFNEQLEKLIKKYFGVKECVLTNSCASALLAALIALDLPAGSEVIVPSFTFVASANAIVLAGLKPVFAEIDIVTGNLDVKLLGQCLTKKTRAIMPVHFAGQPANMPEIMQLAKKHNLRVVEDSAECLGGKWNGRLAGTFGNLGCFSFWATKNITTGEGGAIITNNRRLAEKLRAIIAHGVPSSTLDREHQQKPWLREAVLPGFNFRMSNLAAAVGAAQFKKINQLNRRRRQLARRLTTELKSVASVIPLEAVSGVEHVYQMYPVRLAGIDRTKFIAKLQRQGIQASVHFDPPVHRQKFYRQFARGVLPVTDKLAQTEVTLPLYPDMSFDQIDILAKAVKKAAAERS